MPRVIFTSRYIKPNSSNHKSYLIKYIATRDGAEKVISTNLLLETAKNQIQLINKIVSDFPDVKSMHEYADYVSSPTRKTASELISRAIEDNIDSIGNRRNYMDYIANRPRVDKLGTHGLFTDDGVPIVLEKVANEVENHSGNVWTNVISLRREDAARLGFDSANSWVNLIRSKRAQIAESMKIPQENLKWYASFHNESHHPHVHIVVYSTDPKKGYLTEKGIESMRSMFAREIFKNDLIHIYKEQTIRRDEISEQALITLQDLINQMSSGVEINQQLENDLIWLAKRLKNTGGKKVYGYLKADVKAIINRIIDELSKIESVAKCYVAWYEMKRQVLRSYMDKMPEIIPLSQQKELSKIRQIVIDEALRIASGKVVFERDDELEISEEEHFYDDESEQLDSVENVNQKYNVTWSFKYKQARKFLFGDDENEPNFAKAIDLFLEESNRGNALAMHDVGRIYMCGLGVDKNKNTAHDWYAKALGAFLEVGKIIADAYIKYRIGKLYFAGLGVEQNYEKAYEFYKKSADQNNSYAAFETAKMLRDGIGVTQNEVKADSYFKVAFDGFVKLEKREKDDKLQYRIGRMLYDGVGVEKNVLEAIKYFEKSAKLDNQFAQYALGKIYLMDDDVPCDKEKARFWLTLAAEQGNEYARFFLENMDKHEPSVVQGVFRLFHHMSRIFEESALNIKQKGHTDSKIRRKEREKKIALGHAHDDYFPGQIL